MATTSAKLMEPEMVPMLALAEMQEDSQAAPVFVLSSRYRIFAMDVSFVLYAVAGQRLGTSHATYIAGKKDSIFCLFIQSLYSSVAERQSCKLKVLGSIPSGG